MQTEAVNLILSAFANRTRGLVTHLVTADDVTHHRLTRWQFRRLCRALGCTGRVGWFRTPGRAPVTSGSLQSPTAGSMMVRRFSRAVAI